MMRRHREYHFLWTQGQSQLGGAAGSWWWRGGNQIKDGTFHNAARSSRQPATQGSLGPAQTICSHLLATVTMSTELELEMSLCMTISALSLHASTTSPLYLGRCSAGRGGAGWGCLQAAA